MNETIVNNYNEMVSPKDTVYFLGDVVYDPKGQDYSKLEIVSRLNGHKKISKGNYDEYDTESYLEFFKDVYDNNIIVIGDNSFYLNHYPKNGRIDMFNLVGHVHGAWKIARNMLNLSVDVWHFKPVSLTQVLKYRDSIRTYYDINAFPGELPCNQLNQ